MSGENMRTRVQGKKEGMNRGWHSHGWNRSVVLRSINAASRILSEEALYRSGRKIADVFRMHAERDRQAIESNLRRALCHLDAGSKEILEEVSIRLFRNFALCMIDLFRAQTMTPEESSERYLKEIDGEKYFLSSAERGKGTILLTGHLGNWEMAAQLFAERYRGSYVVSQRESSLGLDRQRRRVRMRRGVKEAGGEAGLWSGFSILKLLRDNRAVSIQCDRHYGGKTAAINFFGSPAFFPVAPIRLGALSGADLLPVFFVRSLDSGYRAIVKPRLNREKETNDPERIRQILKKFVNYYEKYIGIYPDQWFNFYPFWGHEKEKEV